MSHKENNEFRALNPGDQEVGTTSTFDSSKQQIHTGPKPDHGPGPGSSSWNRAAIRSGGQSVHQRMSAESTIQKMNEFHGEDSIYDSQPITLPGEDVELSSSTITAAFFDDSLTRGGAPANVNNMLMTKEQLKSTHDEMVQLSQPGNEGALLSRYEELSSLKAQEAETDPLVGVTLDEKYKITGIVGTGANAIVYRAVQLDNNRIVAIKTIKNRGMEDIWRFNLEIESMRKMDQDNLVQFIDKIIQEKGRIFLVMELVSGISLHEVLKIHGPITDEHTICKILGQVCDALAHAHRNKIIHRDLKTGNIILSKEKNEKLQVKVLDFGLAKHKNLKAANITMHGKTLGSPLYMSPEQCKGEEPTIQSDIYSLGILAYEMMTGIVPYIGDNIPDIMAAHCDPNVKHIPLAEVCPNLKGVDHLDRIIGKALNTNPNKRFRRVTRMRQALEFWIEGVKAGAYKEEERLDAIIDEDIGIYQNINSKFRRSLEVTLQILPSKPAKLEFDDITLLIEQEKKPKQSKKNIAILIAILVVLLIVAATLVKVFAF